MQSPVPKPETLSRSKLPIQHPDYQYPQSQNPYWKKVRELPGKIFSDQATEQHAGSWRRHFTEVAGAEKLPLVLEIGCNGGHVLIEWAKLNPGKLYLGLDWKFKQIFFGAEKAKKRGLGNAIFLRSHAERINYVFGPEELDEIAIYFPDPWAKKSQWKNRYITESRLETLAGFLKPGGLLHIKTDHAGYFDWIEVELEKLSKRANVFEAFEKTRDLHAGNPNPLKLEIPAVTLFEKIFIKEGIPIHSVKLRKL